MKYIVAKIISLRAFLRGAIRALKTYINHHSFSHTICGWSHIPHTNAYHLDCVMHLIHLH